MTVDIRVMLLRAGEYRRSAANPPGLGEAETDPSHSLRRNQPRPTPRPPTSGLQTAAKPPCLRASVAAALANQHTSVLRSRPDGKHCASVAPGWSQQRTSLRSSHSGRYLSQGVKGHPRKGMAQSQVTRFPPDTLGGPQESPLSGRPPRLPPWSLPHLGSQPWYQGF